MVYDALLNYPSPSSIFSFASWLTTAINFNDPKVAFVCGCASILAIQAGIFTSALKVLQVLLPTSLFVPLFLSVSIFKLSIKVCSKRVQKAFFTLDSKTFNVEAQGKSRAEAQVESHFEKINYNASSATTADVPAISRMRKPRSHETSLPTSSFALAQSSVNPDMFDAGANAENIQDQINQDDQELQEQLKEQFNEQLEKPELPEKLKPKCSLEDDTEEGIEKEREKMLQLELEKELEESMQKVD